MDGFLHPDFLDVARELRRQLRSAPGGGAVCVYHEGECVVDLWGGVRDEEGRRWQRGTMAPSFSTTKGVASTLIHVLRDRGLLSYDDPVCRYWPEFAQEGKERITIRHVLSHQSGLYHIRKMIDGAHRMLDWEHMIRAIECTRPVHAPGRRSGYHGLTYGFIVGEIAQRVTGRPFPELVREELARPLGVDELHVGAPEEALARAARLIWPRWAFLGKNRPLPELFEDTAEMGASLLRVALRPLGIDLESTLEALAPRGISGFDFSAAETLRAAIPAACGLFSARALARMYSVLANGGSVNGTHLFSRETFQLATARQRRVRARAVIPFEMGWRLGYHSVPTTRGIPRSAFGHFGFGGSGAWADPRRKLAVALVVNSGIGSPFGDSRIVRIGGAALACANRRYRRRRSFAEPAEPKAEAPTPLRPATKLSA